MKNFYKLTLGLLLCLSINPSYSSDTAQGFKDLGDSFEYFCHDGKGKYSRKQFIDFVEYFKINPESAIASCHRAALIFGGGHLTADEGYELSKNYAKNGDFQHLHMFLPGYLNHLGHTVINLDPKTCPDFVADFREEGIIQKLKLGDHNLVGRFDEVMFENVSTTTAYNISALKNAYEALKPNGNVVIFSGSGVLAGEDILYNYLVPQLLLKAGFSQIEITKSCYHDILTGRYINPISPIVIAYKPAQNATLNTKKK